VTHFAWPGGAFERPFLRRPRTSRPEDRRNPLATTLSRAYIYK